ncbi:MAG: hypothetical protein SO147_05430 [Clostridia bacterium]|nr:hypothetical protein [Clostridia bacterium]
MKQLKITFIGSYSNGWVWSLIGDLALDASLCGEVVFYDDESEFARNNAQAGNHIGSGGFRYRFSESLADALTDADAVLISLSPGNPKAMRAEIEVPKKYGIYQSNGMGTGVGGFFRGLRTVPVMVELMEAVASFAPEAAVINLTDPVGLCVRAMYDVLPGIKGVGFCHESALACQVLADALGEQRDLWIERNQIQFQTMGINHFSFFQSAFYEDTDLFPVFEEYCARHRDGMVIEEGAEPYRESQKVRMDLFQRLGLYPAAGDRLLAEFCPPGWYLKDEATIRSWGFSLTSAADREREDANRRRYAEEIGAGKGKLTVISSGTDLVPLIKALTGCSSGFYSLSLPNRGQISNLEEGAIVETGVLCSKNGIQPVLSGEMPLRLKRLTQPHLLMQQLTMEAAVMMEREYALEAFFYEPSLAGLSRQQIQDLFDEIYEYNIQFMPGWE